MAIKRQCCAESDIFFVILQAIKTKNNMEPQTLLDYIPQESCFYYNFGGCWANGKEGAIADPDGHAVYRFFRRFRDENGKDINKEKDFDDYVTNPVVATGVIGYWLHFRKNNNSLSSYTTWEKNAVHKNTIEIFTDYTADKLKQYISREQDSPDSWRRDLEREFYTEFIILNEAALNEQTNVLLDYITPSDQQQVKEIMAEYMLFLESKKKAYMQAADENPYNSGGEMSSLQPGGNPPAKPTRKKGRPSKVFEDFVHGDAPKELMPVLQEMMNEANGRTALTIILSITGVYIDKPTAKSVCDRFNTVGETAYGREVARHEGRTFGRLDFSKNPEPIGAKEQNKMLDRIKQKIEEAQ